MFKNLDLKLKAKKIANLYLIKSLYKLQSKNIIKKLQELSEKYKKNKSSEILEKCQQLEKLHAQISLDYKNKALKTEL